MIESIRVTGVLITLFLGLLCAPLAWSNGEYGLPVADAESAGMSTARLGAITERLQPLIDQKKIAGVITVVARQGKVVHFNAMGSMDVERGKPMRHDTIFRMYSMTKPVTGAAIMILVDDGKVAVSDPVTKYIPEFADIQVLVQNDDGTTSLVPAAAPMTIKHLLTHTAGLTYGFFNNPVAQLYKQNGVENGGSSGMTLEEFAIKTAAQPLIAHPGTQWNYSVSMDVLGRVVEVASGKRFGDFLENRIFDPLGMKDSGFQIHPEQLDRFAANYAPDRAAGGAIKLVDDPSKSRYLQPPSQDSGGGGMVGTAADYLRFAQMLLNYGDLDGVRILSKAAVVEMTSDQLPADLGDSPLSTLIPFGVNGLGFGYCGAVVRDTAVGTVFGGPGQYSWGGAASTDFWIDHRQKLVGMVLTQLIPAGSQPTRMIMNTATYEAVVEDY